MEPVLRVGGGYTYACRQHKLRETVKEAADGE